MARSANSAGELVHDAAHDVGVVVLNVLTQLDHIDRIHLEPCDLLQRDYSGNFECR